MEGFTFFKSYLDQIQKVPEEHRLAAYEAICRYAIYGEDPDFSGGEIFADLIFTGAKPTLDAAIRKSEAGKAGGRGNKKEEENTDKAEEKQEESKPKAEQKQTESKAKADGKVTESYKDKYMDKDKDMDKDMDKNISVRPEAGRPSEADLVKEFEELWKLYPRKEGHDAAKKAYVTARKSKALPTTMEEVRDGLLAYCRKVESEKTEKRYIMQGSTFFRGRRWTDDFTISARDRPPAGRSSAAEEMQDYYDMTARWAGGGGG